MDTSSLLLGVIGQGYVGKHYGDDLEDLGYKVVRYSLEKSFVANKEKIKECDIVFIAVPTPTTPDGFDDSIVRSAVSLVGKGKIAVIKSTIIPGTTVSIQEQYSDRIVFFSPEFLSEVTARQDVSSPFASVVGTAIDDETHRKAAEEVLAILPSAPFSMTCMSTEAEIFKYAHNVSGYFQVVFFNLLYDLAVQMGQSWDNIGKAIAADPYISNRYSNPVHKSGRGAGGNCFIKDFAALHSLYERTRPNDLLGLAVFDAMEKKNIDLLGTSGKDQNILKGVYGEHVLEKP
jgi:nucleotide sugar dehydrogenase